MIIRVYGWNVSNTFDMVHERANYGPAMSLSAKECPGTAWLDKHDNDTAEGQVLLWIWFISEVSRNCRCLVLLWTYWACEDNSPIRGFIHIQRPEQMGITESLFKWKFCFCWWHMDLGCPEWKQTEAGFVVAWHVILSPHQDEDKWQRERTMISVYKM